MIGKVTAWTQKTRTDSIEGLRRLRQIFKRELISSQKQRFQLKLFCDAFSREKKAKVIFDQGHPERRKLGEEGKTKQLTLADAFQKFSDGENEIKRNEMK